VRWIEKNCEPQRHRDTENGQSSGFRVQGLGNEQKPLSLVTEWEVDVEEWEGARNAGRSVESLCVELQITRAKLTMLTKEYCGLTAQELVDGFKVRGLRKHLVARFREAAERMWGIPGALAAWKWEGFRKPSLKLGAETGGGRDGSRVSGSGFRERHGQPTANGGCPWHTAKRSRYFRMRPEEYAGEERYEERERRTAELAREVRREFDLESWAASAGFGNGARLKRACVNVLGKSLRTLERQLAAEVVRYYLCAEDKVLREVAMAKGDHPDVIRARWVYNKSEDPPTEPFLDEWSKHEALARDWLETMRGEFG
jgi:hypothetical protein